MNLNKIIMENEPLAQITSLSINHKSGFSYFESALIGFAYLNKLLFSEHKSAIADFYYNTRDFLILNPQIAVLIRFKNLENIITNWKMPVADHKELPCRFKKSLLRWFIYEQ